MTVKDTLLLTRGPVVDALADKMPPAWMAVEYQKTISNNLSADEKQARYKQFAMDSQQDFNRLNVNQFVYLNRIGYGNDLRMYEAAISPNGGNTAKLIVLKEVNEPFEARNGYKLPWVFGSFAIGSALFVMMLFFFPLLDGETAENATDAAPAEKSSGLKEWTSFFVPREGFFITPLLIDLNLVIFIFMAISTSSILSFSGPFLLKWGADFRPLVVKGEYWRLLTSMFLHGGIMHVLLNMYALIFIGIFLEKRMGRARYLSAYLITGLVGSLASVWWHPATVSVGASGAIFGMYGVFLALLTTNTFPKTMRRSFLISTSFFIIYNLLAGINGSIDNAAHIGGLITGVLIGYLMYPALRNNTTEETEDNTD